MCKVFEFVAYIRTLARGILYHGSNASGLAQCDINGFGHDVEAFLVGYLAQRTARMEIESVESQLFAALHFVKKCSARFLQCFAVWVPEIYEIAVVGHDGKRLIAKSEALLFERVYRFLRKRG